MARGIVKHIDGDGRFVFVRPDDGGRDIFVSRKVMERCGVELERGDAVEFETFAESHGKSPCAKSVRALDEAVDDHADIWSNR